MLLLLLKRRRGYYLLYVWKFKLEFAKKIEQIILILWFNAMWCGLVGSGRGRGQVCFDLN